MIWRIIEVIEVIAVGIGAAIAVMILALIGAAIVQVPLAVFGGVL